MPHIPANVTPFDYTTSKPPFQPLRAFKSPANDGHGYYQLHTVDRHTNAMEECVTVTAAELRALRDEIDALLAEVGG